MKPYDQNDCHDVPPDDGNRGLPIIFVILLVIVFWIWAIGEILF